MKNLSEIKKENPFLVPEGYFDQLEQNVMLQVKQVQRQEHRRRIFTISVAAAAVVALLVAINVWIFLPDNNQDPQLAKEVSNSNSILLASGNEYGVLTTGEALPAVDFESSDFDNVDYQIIDYYSDELSQLDNLY